MKRLLIIASLAILAMSCEKTIVSNGVRTPIGFSTEVGKQTRAVVQNNAYPTVQPFAVYAYGHQDAGSGDVVTPIMNNVEVSYTAASNDGQTPAKWSATGTTKYYWPNDPRTTINFYAYSPAYITGQNAQMTQNLKNHQKLSFDTSVNGYGISHSENGGFNLVGYKHDNMYVDFMVATPVIGATFGDQDGNGNSNPDDAVPVSFSHKMTQIVFNVQKNGTYENITFLLKSIKLANIKNVANVENGNFTNASSGSVTYTVFPAVAETDANGAPDLQQNQSVTYPEGLTVGEQANTTDQIIPVTMIPQAFDNNGQKIIVEYTISGTGVASETVVSEITLTANNSPAWATNKKITYKLLIGLNEILFEPTVQNWDTEESGNIDI